MKKKTIFIGGGLREPLILSLLPVIDGFCQNKEITTVIFEKQLTTYITKSNIYKRFKKSYDIKFLDKVIDRRNIFLKLLYFIPVLTLIFLISFLTHKKIIFNFKNRFVFLQILFSIWETGKEFNKYQLDKLEFVSRIKTCFLVTNKIIFFNYLKKNIILAIFGHTVHSDRTLFALLRNSGIKIILFKSGILSCLFSKNSFHYNNVEKKIYIKSLKSINKKKIHNYWKQYREGNSNYHGAKTASRITPKKKYLKLKKHNVIMLHIFKDTPNMDIDKDRIFVDFFDWIKETLKIIKNTNEIWIIRKHPLAKRWGENQKFIINKIFKEVFGANVPKNIRYEEDLTSNFLQLENAQKIVTFTGNSHLEAASMGRKPIIISNTTLSSFGNSFFHKPTTIQNYRKILLSKDYSKFLLSKKKIIEVKRIIFLLQNVLNISKELGISVVLRNDHQSKFHNLKKKVILQSSKNYSNIFKIGSRLGRTYSQSIGSKYKFFFY